MSSIAVKNNLQNSWNLGYRQDIDGLRAIAVGSVFVFHLMPAWLPGGFVGVDVFFVISGYLITSILMRDLQSGRMGIADFYHRRIARLFPTMFTVVASVMLLSWVLYTPQDFASAGINSIAAMLSLANIKFYLQGNYFEISKDAQPLLHFWSLSIEEQYYLFYPIFLMAIARWRTSTIGATVTAISLVSLLACSIVTFSSPKAAFYLLPFRAWELGLGGTAAFIAQGVWGGSWTKFRSEVALFGLTAIIMSLILFHEGIGFPGHAAILPVLGTAALLIAGHNGDYPGSTLLSTKAMVAVGKTSYTLYLWHWPVFSFVDYTLFSEPEWLRVALKIVISVLLTWATYTLIEKPARQYLNIASRRLYVFVGFAAVIAVMVPVGTTIRSNNYVDASIKQVTQGGVIFPGLEGAPTVVLIGDSHGSMYAKMLRDMSLDRNFTLHVASVAAGDALPNSEGKSSDLWEASANLIERLEPSVVVIANDWSGKLYEHRSRLDLALELISQHSPHIVVLNQPPILPAGLSRAAIREGAQPPFFEENESAEKRKSINAYLLSFVSESIDVIDVSSIFLDADDQVLFTDEHGRWLYQDANHLSGFGAEEVRSQLEAVLEQL